MSKTGSKQTGSKQTETGPDWIRVVDGVLDRADRFADRFRKAPRKRLDFVPQPLVPVDPFGAAARPIHAEGEIAGPTTGEPAPLGDAGLVAQIYGRRTCDVTGRAVQLLREKSLTPRMIDMDDPDRRDLENRLIRETKRYQTPYVYLRGEYIGGFDELAELAKTKEFDVKIAPKS